MDLARKRISLTMKLGAKPGGGSAAEPPATPPNAFKPAQAQERARPSAKGAAPAGSSPMADAFARLQARR